MFQRTWIRAAVLALFLASVVPAVGFAAAHRAATKTKTTTTSAKHLSTTTPKKLSKTNSKKHRALHSKSHKAHAKQLKSTTKTKRAGAQTLRASSRN